MRHLAGIYGLTMRTSLYNQPLFIKARAAITLKNGHFRLKINPVVFQRDFLLNGVDQCSVKARQAKGFDKELSKQCYAVRTAELFIAKVKVLKRRKI